MKRILFCFAAALLLTGCAARQSDARADAIQARYAAMGGYAARVETAVVRETETARYALEVVGDGESTRVTVLAPEELAGVAATVEGDALTLTFDGMALDAGSVDPGVSALNAVDVALRAAAEGWIVEQNAERFADVDALRLCFETERGGEPLRVAVWFNEQGLPLYAELERGGAVVAYLEFTDFALYDKMEETTEKGEDGDGSTSQTDVGGDRP